MSLVKHAQTEKQLAANRRNIQLAHGPVTDQGWERIRAAHLRHGFYAEGEEVALRALGEDPEHFRQLLQALWQDHEPRGVTEEWLVFRLGRAIWLMNRADRMLEGSILRQAEELNSARPDRLHARMMRLTITAQSLERLADGVAQDYYVTDETELQMMKNLQQEGILQEQGEIAVALFYRLRTPVSDENGEDEYEKAKRVVAQVKEIFGVGMASEPRPSPSGTAGAAGPDDETPPEQRKRLTNPERYPYILPEEWEARERPRQLLENLLKRLAAQCRAQRKGLIKESVNGPSLCERAAEVAPTHPEALLMRRILDANFREVRRVTRLLLEIQRARSRSDAVRVLKGEVVAESGSGAGGKPQKGEASSCPAGPAPVGAAELNRYVAETK